MATNRAEENKIGDKQSTEEASTTAFADRLCQWETPILQNLAIAQDTFKLRICTPQIAKKVVPGQFVMIRMTATNDPLIGRALAVYDVDDETIELVYIRKGKLTQRLADSGPGTSVTVWGPLGNGFPTKPCNTLYMVAGGIGQTPFLMLAKDALGLESYGQGSSTHGQWANHVECLYGARTASLLAGVCDFEKAGVSVHICTDDGSAGNKEQVPDALDRMLAEKTPTNTHLVCCGPEIMMKKVAQIAEKHQMTCDVSLETPMACGIGICFSCVAKVRQNDNHWDYKRTCIEGPIFDASQIDW